MAVFIALVVGFAAGSVVGWVCGRMYADAANFDEALAQQRRGDYWFNEYRRAAIRNEVSK